MRRQRDKDDGRPTGQPRAMRPAPDKMHENQSHGEPAQISHFQVQRDARQVPLHLLQGRVGRAGDPSAGRAAQQRMVADRPFVRRTFGAHAQVPVSLRLVPRVREPVCLAGHREKRMASLGAGAWREALDNGGGRLQTTRILS